MRASHCIDQCFWFYNTDLMLTHTGGGARPRALSEKMANTLLRFMKTGNPNGGGLPDWPEYSSEKGEMMFLDDIPEVQFDPDREARKPFRHIFNRQTIQESKPMKMKKAINTSVVLLICLFTLNLTAAAQSGNLRVGAGKVSITPPDYMFPTGVEHKNFIGVHDSVFVRSIVLDNGITRAALVSLEMGNPPEKEEFYEAITRELNIRAEHLFISATHSHNTLSIDQYPGKNAAIYYDLVINATIKSLKDATARLQPARVGYATGKAYVNTNRDQKIGEGYHMGYNPDGPSDKTVTVVTFTSLSGDPIAVYANYPCHAVLMYRAKTRDGHQELSGDLPGATSRYIESHFNGP